VSKKAIFLDRDGVINVKLPEDRYVRRPSELSLIPGAVEALRILRRLGYVLVIVTNQRGIARGFMTAQDLDRVHEVLKQELSRNGGQIDAVYYCPHDTWEACSCRKPEPGLVLTAARDWDVDLEASYLVGDSPSDVGAGRRARTRTVRISTDADEEADLVFPSLLDFARHLEREADESAAR
jgi:D-glycero-D-manno-heptose 1,7-bisphosphate phosphatase